MKKKKKTNNNKVVASQTELPAVNEAVDTANQEQSSAPQSENVELAPSQTNKKESKKAKKEEATVSQKDKQKADKAKADKKKKTNGKEKVSLRRKTRETFAELKKVTWPSFADVCKKTGVVLVVVLIFAVIIFGIDFGLGKLMGLLRK